MEMDEAAIREQILAPAPYARMKILKPVEVLRRALRGRLALALLRLHGVPPGMRWRSTAFSMPRGTVAYFAGLRGGGQASCPVAVSRPRQRA